MRRIFGAVLAGLALLVLGILAGGGTPAAGSPLATLHAPGGPTAAGGMDVPNGTRKLPPPAGRTSPAAPAPGYEPLTCLAPVVNASQRSGNEDESFVVINPTNPNNLVAFSNLETNSVFRGYSIDGGATWTRGTVATGQACCDGQAVFNSFGNLFLVYINGNVNEIDVILSTDGGITFSSPTVVGTGSVDQPSIAAGNGNVLVDWNSSGSMVARGAP